MFHKYLFLLLAASHLPPLDVSVDEDARKTAGDVADKTVRCGTTASVAAVERANRLAQEARGRTEEARGQEGTRGGFGWASGLSVGRGGGGKPGSGRGRSEVADRQRG